MTSPLKKRLSTSPSPAPNAGGPSPRLPRASSCANTGCATGTTPRSGHPQQRAAHEKRSSLWGLRHRPRHSPGLPGNRCQHRSVPTCACSWRWPAKLRRARKTALDKMMDHAQSIGPTGMGPYGRMTETFTFEPSTVNAGEPTPAVTARTTSPPSSAADRSCTQKTAASCVWGRPHRRL